MQRKRLYFDIETSPNIVFSWRVGYKISLDYDNIIKERKIICACWKWEGKAEVHSAAWSSGQSDVRLLQKLIKALNEADEIVGHNGDKFDLPWVRTRAIKLGLKVPPGYKTTDTLKLARRFFNFNSNRLDYLAKYLGVGEKIKTEFGMWKKICLENDEKALDRMVRYCKRDVKVLERVHQAMLPYVPVSHNHAILHDGGKADCPECGSTRVRINKTRTTLMGQIRRTMLCNNCGRYFVISDKTYRDSKGISE